MTYPEQPPPPSPYYAYPPRPPVPVATWLHAATFATGVVLLFLGFAPWSEQEGLDEGFSPYEAGAGWAPMLSFVAGSVALLAVLPGTTRRPGPIVPALTTGLMLESFFSLFVILDGVELAAGGILAIIFNVIMASLAISGYVLDVRAARGVPAPPVAYPATPTTPGQR